MTPNKENIRAWVAALRSGAYKQGRNALRSKDGNEFCCLGVACEVYDSSRWGLNQWNEMTYMDEGAALPPAVAEWLGLELNRVRPGGVASEACDPYLLAAQTPGGEKIGTYATAANDSCGWTFPQIADSIERTYLSDAE